MLLPSFLESSELQNVVLHFFQHKFGVSSCGNFFDPNLIFLQDAERLKHFFRHSPLFAQSHILQLCGFGEPRNPFAMLFELSKHLKSRKERKERRRSTKTSIDDKQQESDDIADWKTPMTYEDYFASIDSPKIPYEFPLNLNIWKESVQHVNVTSMKCGMIVMRRFLYGPIAVSYTHLDVYKRQEKGTAIADLQSFRKDNVILKPTKMQIKKKFEKRNDVYNKIMVDNHVSHDQSDENSSDDLEIV